MCNEHNLFKVCCIMYFCFEQYFCYHSGCVLIQQYSINDEKTRQTLTTKIIHKYQKSIIGQQLITTVHMVKYNIICTASIMPSFPFGSSSDRQLVSVIKTTYRWKRKINYNFHSGFKYIGIIHTCMWRLKYFKFTC